MMDYLVSDKNTLIWLYFTIYAMTALFLVPRAVKPSLKTVVEEDTSEQSLQFASGLILRTTLIIPMLFLLKNAV